MYYEYVCHNDKPGINYCTTICREGSNESIAIQEISVMMEIF